MQTAQLSSIRMQSRTSSNGTIKTNRGCQDLICLWRTEMTRLSDKTFQMKPLWGVYSICVHKHSRRAVPMLWYATNFPLKICDSANVVLWKYASSWVWTQVWNHVTKIGDIVFTFSKLMDWCWLQVCTRSWDHKWKVGNAWIPCCNYCWGSNRQGNLISAHILCQAQWSAWTAVRILNVVDNTMVL